MDLDLLTSRRATVRGWTATRLLAALAPAEASAARARLARGGRSALWIGQAESAGAPPAPSAAPHPSWLSAALRALPASVARLHLDRLGPGAARAVPRDDPAFAAVALSAPALPSPVVDAWIGRVAPPTFPPPPAWANPLGSAARAADGAARDRWPAGSMPPEGETAVADTCAAAGAPASRARGLARLAFALLLRPDDVHGLAGAWPREDGRPLLAAWNAWPGALTADASVREAAEAAARFVGERWTAWVA